MAHAIAISCLAILLLVQPMAATRSDFFSSLSPFLSPVGGDVCREVECGRGTCKPSNSSNFFYECECEAGWRQISSPNHTHFKFLPCVLPNCTMDYSCQAAPSPAQDGVGRANMSIFDPCIWMDCMGGSCKKKSIFSYGCSCAEGAIGMDCKNLGIGITNTSAPPAPVLSENGNNQASSIHAGNTHWLVLLMISLGVIW